MSLGPVGLMVNINSVFMTPVTEEFGVSKGNFMIWITILSIVMFAMLPVAGRLFATRDARLILTIACLLSGGTTISMAFYTAIWQYYVAGVPAGIAMAFLLYLANPTLIGRWFKIHSARYIGIAMAFTGIGTAIFAPIDVWIMTNHGYRTAYLVNGIVALCISLPFTLFVIRSRPEDLGLRPYGDDGVVKGDTVVATPPKGVPVRVARRSGPFFALCAWVALVNAGLLVFQYLPSYALSLPIAAVTGAAIAGTIASAAMIGQACGKIGLGFVGDKSVYGAMFICLACGFIGLAVLWLAPSATVLVIGPAVLFGIFYAGPNVVCPAMARQIFGTRGFAQTYSGIAATSAIAGAFAASLWGYLIGTSGYTGMFATCLVFIVVATGLGIYALQAGKKLVQTESDDEGPYGTASAVQTGSAGA